MKKFLKTLLICLIIIPTAFMFSGCGKDGLSAYDIAKNNGFEGTEAEWLESLKCSGCGEDGKDGKDGKDGNDALSTYEIWLSLYSAGKTELEYVDWVIDNFNVVADLEEYVVNKNLLSVVEVKSFSNEKDLSFNQNHLSGGTAVIYEINEDDSMYLVTNYHVVYGGSSYEKSAYPLYRLKFYEQDSYYYLKATFVGGSSTYDLAVLKVSKEEIEENPWVSRLALKPVSLKTSVATGSSVVLAIGNTNSAGLNTSRGNIDVVSEYVDITIAGKELPRRVIRHDAYISNGNSGGGLFDLYGNLVGITNGGQKNNDKVNYAIPADLVERVADEIIEKFEADSSQYQIDTVDLKIKTFTFDTISTNNDKTGLVEITNRFRVSTIEESSIFYEKLVAGDEFVSITINGQEKLLNKTYLFEELLLTIEEGDKVSFKVLRGGETVETAVVEIASSDLVVVE